MSTECAEYTNKKSIDFNEKYNDLNEEDTDVDLVREYYTSNNKMIRNGKYGTVYPFNYRSSDVYKLFSVIDATGRCDSAGIKLNIGRKTGKVNKTSNIIYYDSPAQYMSHKKVKLNDKTVKAWEERVQKIAELENDTNESEKPDQIYN